MVPSAAAFDDRVKPISTMERLLAFLCCSGGLCQYAYDCLRGARGGGGKGGRGGGGGVDKESESSVPGASRTASGRIRIRKEDIEYLIDPQPVTRFDSVTSRASTVSGRGSVHGDSPPPPPRSASFRDRFDSDRSQESSSGGSSCSAGGGRTSSSGSEYRRVVGSQRPAVDAMRPIEFWTANREPVQPRSQHQQPQPRRRLPSESEISLEDLRPDLYASESADRPDDDEDCLTDEEKLTRFQLGQIHFSVHYEIGSRCLVVRMIEARDLPPPYPRDSNRQDAGVHSNPYARICLLPDRKDSQQTTVQRKTQDPTWEESFRFDLSLKEVHRRVLEITVKDFDKYSRHCVVGQVHLALESVNVIKGGHMWKPLLPCSSKVNSDLGEILLSLNYLPTAGRLNIDVIKAHQVLQTDLIGGADPFVKVSLVIDHKLVKTKKTSIQKNTLDPVYNESLSFNVAQDQLRSCSLVVTVWDYNSKAKDEFIGRVVMGRQSTSHFEAAHWNKMVRCQRSPIAQWHTLLSREECHRKCELSLLVP